MLIAPALSINHAYICPLIGRVNYPCVLVLCVFLSRVTIAILC